MAIPLVFEPLPNEPPEPHAAADAKAFKVDTHDHLGPFHTREFSIRVPAWVTPEDLADFYRDYRAKLLSSPRLKERDPGARTLAAFKFVMHRAPVLALPAEWRTEYGGTADLPTWRCLVSEWNAQAPPEWQFTDETGLWKAVARCRDILFPALRPIPGLPSHVPQEGASE